MLEEDVRFRNLEKKIGIFVAITIIVIALAALMIAMKNDLFTKTYTLIFTVEKGTGFSRGMPVKLSGFRIGRISAISLNEQAMVDVEIQIDRKYQKWIRGNSFAQLSKEGLVGDVIVEVSVGSNNSPVLDDRDHLRYVKTKGLEEVANDIAEQIKPVLVEAKEVLRYFNDPDGDMKQSLKNIRLVSASLGDTKGHIDRLLQQVAKDSGNITADTVKVLQTTNRTISDLQPAIRKIDETITRISPYVDKAGATIENVEKTSHDVRRMSETVLPRVSPLLRKTEDVLESTDSTLNALQGVWPIRNHVLSPPYKEIIPGYSHD